MERMDRGMGDSPVGWRDMRALVHSLTWVGVSQQGADGQQDLGHGQGGRPLLFEDVLCALGDLVGERWREREREREER